LGYIDTAMAAWVLSGEQRRRASLSRSLSAVAWGNIDQHPNDSGPPVLSSTIPYVFTTLATTHHCFWARRAP